MFLDDYSLSLFTDEHKEENELKLSASVKYWCNILLEKLYEFLNGKDFHFHNAN